jgi:hypothetical protein
MDVGRGYFRGGGSGLVFPQSEWDKGRKASKRKAGISRIQARVKCALWD